MPRKKPSAAEISAKLHQVDVVMLQGKSVSEAICMVGMTEGTYYKWRKLYADHITVQGHETKVLKTENARLRRVISDLTVALDQMIVEKARKRHF